MDPSLPGAELIEQGITDLKAGVESVAALLVSIGAPRLRSLGVDVPTQVVAAPELRLYAHLSKTEERGAHSKYNALVRRLVSFERALSCER